MKGSFSKSRLLTLCSKGVSLVMQRQGHAEIAVHAPDAHAMLPWSKKRTGKQKEKKKKKSQKSDKQLNRISRDELPVQVT